MSEQHITIVLTPPTAAAFVALVERAATASEAELLAAIARRVAKALTLAAYDPPQ